nr:MAG TPA: hypothetical protein [Bacteriophage sp.]
MRAATVLSSCPALTSYSPVAPDFYKVLNFSEACFK